MIDPQQVESKVDARYQVFLILWFALLMSVTLFLVLVLVAGSQGTPNPTLSYALLAAGAAIVFASFLMKQQLMRKAIEKRDVAALQSSHIVALALCESAALFGVLDRFGPRHKPVGSCSRSQCSAFCCIFRRKIICERLHSSKWPLR
jgi:predicted MFS family arabinose efflux permease